MSEKIIGSEMGGGYYAGQVMVDGKKYALIVAPKAEGECTMVDDEVNQDTVGLDTAHSPDDGLLNTCWLSEIDISLGIWALSLRISGHDDWYIPSQDELEIIYRNLKPTTGENAIYHRSGINLSAIEPTRPYTSNFPMQTTAELFKEGGEQAFESNFYWSSTLCGDVDVCVQSFKNGCQDLSRFDYAYIARAVRRVVII